MRESPCPIVTDLVTGHFCESSSYRAFRKLGTTDWLLILTLSGSGRFGHIDSSETRTRPGDIVLLRPGCRHDYGTAGNATHWELLWCHFHPRSEWLEWLCWPEESPGMMLISLTEPIIRQKVKDRFVEMHRLATGSLSIRDLFAMNALEELLLWCATQNPRSQDARRDERVQKVVDYMYDHLTQKLTTEVLEEVSGLSPSRISTLFRSNIGSTPHQFLEQLRLVRAQKLLERTTHKIGAIAAEVGFDNPFYFTLRFKQHTGTSPSEWRQRHGFAQSADRHATN